MWWYLVWADVLALVLFGVGTFFLLEPARVVAVARERWDRSRQRFWRMPAFLDTLEVRLLGGFSLGIALLIADVILVYS